MCNLTDHFDEGELMKDPEYLQYLEQKNKEMNEYLDWYLKSIETKVEIEKDPYEHTTVNF